MTSFSLGRDDLKHASDLCGTRCEMGLGKLCDEQSSEEIVRWLSTLKGTVPDGWLKVHQLGRRGRGCGGGLSSPVAGELELHVYLSWKLSETPVLTSAAKNSTVRALKERICRGVGRCSTTVRIWDYHRQKKYASMEGKFEDSLDSLNDSLNFTYISISFTLPLNFKSSSRSLKLGM